MKKKLFLLFSTLFALTACQLSFNHRSSSKVDSSSSSSDTSSVESTSSSSEEESSSSSSSESSSSSNSVSSSESYSSSSEASSSSSAVPTSLPEPTIPLVKAGRTYDDYIKNSVYPLSFCPSTGEAKILVIPIWFEDSNSYITTKRKTNVRSDIEKAYFGTDEDTGWKSVKSYYEEESNGALTLTGTVSDWYRPHQYASTYAPERAGLNQTMNLVTTATDWYFENNPEESRTDYDRNHDGYLDGVMLIYGAPDYSALRTYGDNTNLWAYCYWVQKTSNQNVLNPGPNVFFWASFDFMYGANVYYDRTGVPKTYASGYTKSPVKIDTHTYIHEMGHVFGLTDYYDYSGQYTPAGGFSMQDQNVGGHDPFSSFALGWGEAYIPTESVTVSIRPFSTSGEFIILSPSWNEYDSAFDEYIVIEYFTQDGLNELDTSRPYNGAYPTGSKVPGIRVWHVDARLLYADSFDSNFSPSKVTTDPLTNLGQVELMMSNTYGNKEGYITPLGEAYSDYNLLQLIRNNVTEGYRPKKGMKTEDLFYVGDEFTMEKYGKQFKQQNKLNSGKSLGYTFAVTEINEVYASVEITKL